ncbi:MAG: hypothetical protein ABIH28_00470 [archaeon]
MEPEKLLELSTNLQKASYMLLVLPLVTFIFYQSNIFLIIVYTFFFAIHSLYIHFLISFKKIVAQDVVIEPKNQLKTFWYIPYLWLFVIVTIINLMAFAYSFYLSVINYNSSKAYSQTLLLLHVFVGTLSLFILLFINHIKKNIPREIKKKIKKK